MPDIFDHEAPLTTELRVMLWSVRVWVIGIHHQIDAAARIESVMVQLGAEAALPFLDEFMRGLGLGAKRKIAIHCACHPRVEDDERVLLDILTFAQESRPLEALLLLRGLVHDEAAPQVLRSAHALGTELAFAGQFLGTPPNVACRMPPGGTMPAAMPVKPTLH